MGLVKFGDLVNEVKINIDRNNNPYEYYVAGDHMDSEDLTIRRKGSFATDDVGPAFTRLFKPGQILYGSRRTYLKKVAVADFEGICSNTTFVLETKDENKLRQRLLPFIMLTDDFTKWSISKSKGSTNPYILFSDLANYEFELPDISRQDELVELLWQAYATKESYKEMIRATDEMVKSQFIEDYYNRYESTNLGEHISVIRGVSYKPTDIRESSDNAVAILRSNNISDGEINFDDLVYVSQTCVSEKQYLSPGDIVMCGSNGSKKLVGKAGLMVDDQINTSFGAFCLGIKCKETLAPEYLNAYFNSRMYRSIIEELGNGTNIINIRPDHITSLSIPIPEKDVQSEFVAISRQADKSKFGGFKSQFIEMFGNPMVDEQKYPLKRLGDCCVINPKRSKVTISDSDPVSFVPMPSVSEEGYLQDVSDSEYGSVKKGFTYFENGDVLFAKITPCMENGKGAIAHDLTNGIGMGSTEFHVLRPIDGKSNSYWLFTLTKLPEFREKAAHNMSGTGGQQRVRADFLENFMIGLPPIELQNVLESICRQADKSKYMN